MDPETAQNLVDIIRTASEPHWLQILAWLATVALLGIAIGALIYTAFQVTAIREANKQTALQARASFLLELDRRYESKEMLETRQKLNDMRLDIETNIGTNHPHLGDQARIQKHSEAFAIELRDMKNNKLEDYSKVMRFCGFFETVGLMVHQSYIEIDDIDRLFRGPILRIDVWFRKHIEERQNETGVPAGLYENALYLVDQLKSRPSTVP